MSGLKRGLDRWPRCADVDLFDKALEVVTESLKIFRPHQLTADGLTVRAPQVGARALEIVQEVQAADPARALKTRAKRQRAMLRLRDQLGELADRAIDHLGDCEQ